MVFAFLYSCEDYSELKPLMREHITLLEETIGAVHSSNNPESLCRNLRSFNRRMESILPGYETFRNKMGGPDHLFSAPPSSLKDDIDRIKLLTGSLRDSLLGIHAYTESAEVRRTLILTADTLDKIRD
jgi:hypothetical protein